MTIMCPCQEEEKLHLLATSGSLDTSSVSLSSELTSDYNSSPALPGQLLLPDSTVSRQMLASVMGL